MTILTILANIGQYEQSWSILVIPSKRDNEVNVKFVFRQVLPHFCLLYVHVRSLTKNDDHLRWLNTVLRVVSGNSRNVKFYLSIKIFRQYIFHRVSACELQPFSCHDLANDIYSQTAKTVFSHLKYTHKLPFSY